jgi:SAM-dependent methyltransferase
MTPKCRICSADESDQSIRADFVYGGEESHNFWLCNKCKTVYLFPALSVEEEAFFYKKEFEKFMSSRSGSERDWSGAKEHIKTNQDQVARRWGFLEQHVKKGMDILEIGCSSGFMLNKFRDFGMNCTGIEPSGEFLHFLKKNGYNAFPDISSMRQNKQGKFDLIVHFFVLEHIRNPFDFFKESYNMLKPGGKIIAEVPCVNDPLTSVYNIPEFEKFYWSIAHHYYYSPESISYILGKLGYQYELIPEQRYDLSNHMVWMQEGKPGGMGRYSNIFNNEFDGLYKQNLKDNWLCDTIIVVIEK